MNKRRCNGGTKLPARLAALSALHEIQVQTTDPYVVQTFSDRGEQICPGVWEVCQPSKPAAEPAKGFSTTAAPETKNVALTMVLNIFKLQVT